MELFHAHRQWAERPEDERFSSLGDMFLATKAYADQAREKSVPWSDLRAEAAPDDQVALTGRAGVPAILSHYAFGQLAARVQAPASYLRELPATLAVQNLNHGLKQRADSTGSSNALILFHQNGGLLARAITSERYNRIWNHEIVSRLIDASERYKLVPARPTGGTDLNGSDAPALYASDHDMFAFLTTPERTIIDPTGQPLYRGVITINSEVGDAALKLLGFYYRYICGNHIIWGAENLLEVSLRHVGAALRSKWFDATLSIHRYLNASASKDQDKLQTLSVRIADYKEKVLDTLFGLRGLGIPRKTLDAAYDAVVPAEDGDPRSVWGFVQGLTRLSQQTVGAFADERTALDRAAGKLVELTF